MSNKYEVSFGGFRKLKFLERLQLAFGWNIFGINPFACNIGSYTKVRVNRRTGEVRAATLVSVTTKLSADDHVKEVLSHAEKNPTPSHKGLEATAERRQG
jgi:hypothetical protein